MIIESSDNLRTGKFIRCFLQRASGFNGRFINDNKIGPGAEILITRSGDTIPDVLSIIKPAPGGPQLPDPEIVGQYESDANKVQLVLDDDNNIVLMKKLKHFLETLDIKKMGPGRIKLLVNNNISNINILLNTPKETLMKIIGPKVGAEFYDDLHNTIKNISLGKIMDASGIFSQIGEKSLDKIIESYPNLLEMSDFPVDELIQSIKLVNGFSDNKAEKVAIKLKMFQMWLDSNPQITIENNFRTYEQVVTKDEQTYPSMSVISSHLIDFDEINNLTTSDEFLHLIGKHSKRIFIRI